MPNKMRQPTDKEIEEAKEYIRKRIAAEISMQSNMESAMMEAASEIVGISLKYNIPLKQFRFSANRNLRWDVDRVIEKLRKQIYIYTQAMSVYGREEEKESIIAYINSERHGKTLKQRINEYCNRYKFEIEAAIVSGLIAGISRKELEDNIRQNMKSPYNNKYFNAAVLAGGAISTRIQSGGISYGVGKSNSSFNSLSALTRYTIGAAWMWYLGRKAEKRGAKGFYSYRGSSYPCADCQSMNGKYQPISLYYGQYHQHCKCIFVFI